MTKEYGLPCPVARTLDIIGDRWTLLIVRDLLASGTRKYAELAESLSGIAPNILADRLRTLEEHGIVERETYSEHPPRAHYRLTRKGGELNMVMLALTQWGNRHAYDGVSIIHEACGHDVTLAVQCDHCGERIRPREMRRKFKRREAAIAAGVKF
jgi:DNA-binding HxlR family transcriptional regulator